MRLMTRQLGSAALMALLLGSTMGALPALAEPYRNALYGYSIDLPGAPFAVETVADGSGVTLLELQGRGQIDVYGGENAQRLTPRQFETALGNADRIRDITYAVRGRSWFVISGHYRRDGDSGDDLIFYAKVMFSPDRSRFSAFEASYPVADKRRYDAVIERLEATLRSPANGS